MKHEDAARFPFPLKGGTCDSFHELSYDRESGSYCIDETSTAAEIEAVDFDAFKEAVYQPLRGKTGRLPCSVDALYLHRDTLYAVEFKTGTPENWNLIRKAYDTVMCLTEHGMRGFSYEWARCHMTYVVVCSDEGVKKSIGGSKVANRVLHYTGKRMYSGGKRFENLQTIAGVLVSNVFVQTPVDFENFAKKLNWE